MADHRGSDEFEEIRILGLETPEDVVEPGRSVFGGESESSEEDDFIEITHEGVEYFYNGDTLYDSYMEPIGKVKIVKNKIVDMDEKVQKYHDSVKTEIKNESPKVEKTKEKNEFKGDEFTAEL